MFKLVLHDSRADATVFELVAGATTIGRTPDNGVFILHPSLSRQHARIDIAGDGTQATIRDLGSRNGTFVNGARIEQQRLAPGDEVKLGDVGLRVGGAGPSPAQSPEVAPTISLPISAPRHDALPEPSVRILLEVSRLLGTPEGLQQLPSKILDLISRLIEIDRAVLLVENESTGQLEPRAIKTSAPHDGPIYSQHIVEYVRKNSVAALFADARSDPRVADVRSIAVQSIRASMCVPLRAKDAVLGVLYVDHQSRASHFRKDDLELLAAFASQAAMALENARLYQRLEAEAVQRSRLLRFFPPTTIQRVMLAGGPNFETADAEVTALFCDISGFTALSATLHPREVVALLNDYFPVMADIVFRYEGTLEKYIGDALMAIWGAPFSHRDDADRAVRAAVDMHKALRSLNADWRARQRAPLQIHIGLNSGPVAAGFVGSQSYLQYAAIGDATNVASRVCQAAPPGELFISESTLLKLRDKAFPVEKLPLTSVKGKADALPLYRVRWQDVPT